MGPAASGRAPPRRSGADELGRVVLLFIRLVLRVLDGAVLVFFPRTRRAFRAIREADLRDDPYRWPTGFRATLARTRTAQGLRELTYGATPMSVAVYVLWRAGLSEDGSLLDVGAGRGLVLLAARLLKAEARGIELVESHVVAVRDALRWVGATIEAGDGEGEDLFGVTHIFCAWSAFSEGTRHRLTRDWRRAAPGTRVIVLTHPLVGEGFLFERSMKVVVPWGFDEALVYVRTQSAEGFTPGR